MPKYTDRLRDKAWAYIREYPRGVSIHRLAAALDCSRSQAYNVITQLFNDGLVRKTHKATRGRAMIVTASHKCTRINYHGKTLGCLVCRNIRRENEWRAAKSYYSTPGDVGRASQSYYSRKARSLS